MRWPWIVVVVPALAMTRGRPAEQRTAFANDPLNLIVTTRALNHQKGAGDAGGAGCDAAGACGLP